jgi:hypothetical protein
MHYSYYYHFYSSGKTYDPTRISLSWRIMMQLETVWWWFYSLFLVDTDDDDDDSMLCRKESLRNQIS